MVVDDEPCIQEILYVVLADEGGYDVQCASNGEEALALLNAGPLPDLLVVDMMMPVMDGWGLLTALRLNERLAIIPVIVSSASSNHDAARLGVARMLPKPIDYDAFLEAVDELTRWRAWEPPSADEAPFHQAANAHLLK